MSTSIPVDVKASAIDTDVPNIQPQENMSGSAPSITYFGACKKQYQGQRFGPFFLQNILLLVAFIMQKIKEALGSGDSECGGSGGQGSTKASIYSSLYTSPYTAPTPCIQLPICSSLYIAPYMQLPVYSSLYAAPCIQLPICSSLYTAPYMQLPIQ